MRIRRLEKEEHQKTRTLWEQIFREDSQEFLDYYYTVKAEENVIYVVEEDGDIRSMLHLNPYVMQAGTQTVNTHYIVAVATDERYRKRKYMAALLKAAQQEMREAGEPFAFLMPAAEAIYRPHGFRYVYRQRQTKLTGKKPKENRWEFRPAERKDCESVAEFVNGILTEEQHVFVKRDSRYYETLLKEQASENGGLMLAWEREELAGCFLYAKDREYEIREPVFRKGAEEALAYGIYGLTADDKTEVRCQAYGTEEKPMIMAKILNIPKMFACMEAEEEVSLYLEVYDQPDEESLGRFYISGKTMLKAESSAGEPEVPCGKLQKISIGLLTSLAFGYTDLETAELTEDFRREWRKIRPLDKVFINEIV